MLLLLLFRHATLFLPSHFLPSHNFYTIERTNREDNIVQNLVLNLKATVC